MRKIFNIAHRGASGYKPENTIEAFEKAIELGADFIELDAQKTIDNQIVVYHDTIFTDGTLVMRMSADELKDKAVKTGIKVPLLEEVIGLLNNRVNMNIEIKSVGMIDILISLLQKYNVEKIIISSFIHSCLLEAKGKAPDIERGVLVDKPTVNSLDVLESFGTDLIIGNFEFVSKKNVETLHENNKKIFVWTVNDAADMKKMIDFKVDGIMTDYPDRLNKFLSE